MSRQSRSRALARKHREARQEKARLAAIEKSQKERAALKAKYGSGGLPADYKETEKKAFKEAEEWQEQKTQTQSKEYKKDSGIKARGGILRYPLESLTQDTDYLQIDIVEYKSSKQLTGSVVGSAGTRSLGAAKNVGGTTSGALAKKGIIGKGSILLQIPSNVKDGNSVKYAEDSLNTLTAMGADAVENIMKSSVGKEGLDAKMKAIGDSVGKETANIFNTAGAEAQNLITKKLASKAVGIFGGNVSADQLLVRESGEIFNPNMELLFNGPTLRSFRFSFKMTPRSQDEMVQIKMIIRSFKLNMAPKTKTTDAGNQYLLKSPNIFELRYRQGSRNHPFLHKFKQCFLTDMNVNYTGENVYATYDDGTPISMNMDLTFKEIEPIYDIDYFDDDGNDADNTVGY